MENMDTKHSQQRKKLTCQFSDKDEFGIDHQESLKTDYLEEMGISILCSLSCDENEQINALGKVVTLTQVKKLRTRRRSCTWPAAMLIEFIDLAFDSEMINNKLSSNSSDMLSLSDFDAETEREHVSDADTDADYVEMEVETILSEKTQ